jgi:hypothetical protein
MKKLLIALTLLSGAAFAQSTKVPSVDGTPVAGNCARWTSDRTLGDAGAACGVGAGSGVVDWESILGKPSLFPPEGHTHVPIDITGLVLPQTLACTGSDKFSGFNSATGQFTCTPDQSGEGGTGVITIGASGAGQSGSDQILAAANDTNVTLSVASAANTHTFTAGWTGVLSKLRGGTGQDNSALFFPASGTVALTSQIPPAQVNADWNAPSGVQQILNKPALFSGDYNALTNKPTIPAAQIQSDWTQASTGALDFIKNKPALGSLALKNSVDYATSEVTNKPTLGDAAAKNTGTTSGTVAAGNHAHSGVYEPANASITKLGTTIGASEVDADVATQAELDSGLATKQAALANATTLAQILAAPQTRACLGNDKISAFDAATGGFTCTSDQVGVESGGITTLGTAGQEQTGSSQVLATENDTNVTLSITSATNTHTFTAGWTGTLSKARGGTGQDNSALFFPASGTVAITSQIPPPQVQPDWNAVSGLGQILNKPTLFSGSYTDLTNKPTIPAAQIQSDWNAVAGMGVILNKPTIGTLAAKSSVDYSTSEITNKPTLGDAAAKNTGTIAGTVAAGNHTHTGVYEPADANITKLGSSISASEVAADVATQAELDTGLSTKQSTLTNAATIAKVTESGGLPLWDGGAWPGVSASAENPWDAGFYYPAIPSTNYVFLVRAVPTYNPEVTVTIPASCSGSVLSALVAASGETTILVKKNTTTICTATIAAAGTTATFTGTGGTLTTADKLTIQMGTADATLSGITLSVAGSWQ